MNHIKRFFFFLLFCTYLTPQIAFACGVTLTANTNGWQYGNDSSEQSFISYTDGIEELLISRTFETSQQGVAWVIPIPADPKDIQIDTVDEVPHFSGKLVGDFADEKLDKIRNPMLDSQIWTILPNYIFGIDTMTLSMPKALPRLSEAGSPLSQEVQIYNSLSKGGITTQVITATSGQAILAYLQKQGLQANEESIRILDSYIGEDFAFVTSWITSEDNSGVTKGVKMTFPTQEMFYPLKPGSVYAGSGLPETIYIKGHVTPHIFTSIKHDTTVDYYFNSNNLETFLQGDGTASVMGEPYTKIVINVPPAKLTQDLTLSAHTPFRIQTMTHFINHPLPLGIVLFIFISLFSSFVTLFLFSRKSIAIKTVTLLGLANCITIVGVFIASRRFRLSWYIPLCYSIIFTSLVFGVIALLKAIV